MTNKFSLYDIADEYKNAYDSLFDEDLPAEAINDTLEGLAGTVKEKAINVAAFIKNLDLIIFNIEEAQKKLENKKKSFINKSSKLREYLKVNLEKCDIKKIEDSPYFTIRVQLGAPKLQIEDDSQIPSKYLCTILEEKIDKKLIIKDLKDGAEIEGCKLIVKSTLVID